MYLKLICILLTFVLVACSPVVVKEVTKEQVIVPDKPPVVPDVTCEDGKLYLLYEKEKLLVEIKGVFCMIKQKGKLTNAEIN